MYMYDTSILTALMLMLYASGGIFSLIFYSRHKLCNIVSNLISSAASVLGIWLSISNILRGTGKTVIFSTSDSIPYISFTLTLDKLSSFFILALSLLVLSVSIYSIGYISHYYDKRSVGMFNFLYNFFIITMISVFTSGNIIFFLISWELMSLVSYFMVIFEDEQKENRKAGTIYLIMTHIGTAFLIVAFMLIYKYTHSFEIGASMAAISGPVKNIIFIFLLIGFGTKAGIIPFHIWLPYAHPAAPSNVSALMSGIMIKTAVYGIIRFALLSDSIKPVWWGVLVLGVGAVSAVLGVAYAFMEHNIKKLLAYSSIENIGIILIGVGISFIAFSTGNKVLCGLSLMAALLHVLNHTLFKGVLFLGAGAVHYAAHTKDMEELGGLIKKMPYTGFFFLIASLSISAIPPFNGFISEWFTYQSLFMSMAANTPGVSIAAMVSAAALAMAGAMAAACFVKLIGISFLGLPRSEHAKSANEVPLSMKLGMGLLSLLCIMFGVFPSLIIGLLNRINFDLFGTNIMKQMQGNGFFMYYPITLNKSTISPFMILAAGVLVMGMTFMFMKILNRNSQERKYGTWDCGFKELNPRMQYSATGFSKPLRIIFRALYLPARELKIEEGSSPYYHKSMRYVVTIESIFEKHLYLPVIRIFTRFARRTRLSIQTGSVHAYLIYIFITVIVLLAYYSIS